MTLDRGSPSASSVAQTSHPVQVFVVGTGRSGTQSLAELLSSFPGGNVPHELDPPLLGETTAYLEGRMAQPDMVDLLRRTRAPGLVGGERLTGESNNRLSFLLHPLAEAFPDARIIWLMRDGRDVVSSMRQRGVYHPKELNLRRERGREWARTRIQADTVGDLTPEEWLGLDAFGRVCWYWAYTNRRIKDDLGRLKLPSLLVKIESLSSNWAPIARFLGLPEAPPARIPRSNRSSRDPVHWHLWSSTHREVFQRLCGSVMDEHYPGWEDEMRRGLAQASYATIVRAVLGLRLTVADTTRPLRARLGTRRAPDGERRDPTP